MTTINLYCTGAYADAKVVDGVLTHKQVGCRIVADFNSDWDGLSKRIVVSCGGVTKDAVLDGVETIVPWECLISGERLEIGVDGWDENGKIRIPTIWANCGPVRNSVADAESTPPDPEPSPDIVTQIVAVAGSANEKASRALEAAVTAQDSASRSAENAGAAAFSASESASSSAGSAESASNSATAASNSASDAESAKNAAVGAKETIEVLAGDIPTDFPVIRETVSDILKYGKPNVPDREWDFRYISDKDGRTQKPGNVGARLCTVGFIPLDEGDIIKVSQDVNFRVAFYEPETKNYILSDPATGFYPGAGLYKISRAGKHLVRVTLTYPDLVTPFASLDDGDRYCEFIPYSFLYEKTSDLDERVTELEKGGGTGAVESVNGKTGKVQLDAGDVNAYNKAETDDKLSKKANTSDIPTIPDKLPNPNALTFTGGAEGSYDGSHPVSVNIPNAYDDKEVKDTLTKIKDDLTQLEQLMPEAAPVAGKVLKVLAVNEDGTFTCEWADGGSGDAVDDVQVNGTSVVTDGIANVALAVPGSATTAIAGAFLPFTNSFTKVNIAGGAFAHGLVDSSVTIIENRYSGGRPITASNYDQAVKHALCDTGTATGNAVGKPLIWTPEEQAAAQQRIGILSVEGVLFG